MFYKLDAIGWQDADEAKHASNAYETYVSGNWTVHLFRWEVDYVNSKPPLYFWLTNIMFALFGISTLTAKLPSAIAAIILCAVLAVFLYKQIEKRTGNQNYTLTAVLIYLATFLAMDILFDYHMFRNANFDSVYALFMLVGTICMVKAQKDNRFLIPFGAMAGLAFLAKGFNTTAIVFSAICCIPFLAKEKRIRYILYSVLTATLVVLPWAVKRFMFDGTEFFYHMFFSEAEDKIVGGTLDFFRIMPQSISFRLFFGVLILYVLVLIIKYKSVKEFGKAVFSDIKEYKILWIWFWVPILFYSWAGFCNEWYIYPSYILAAVLSGIYAGIVIETIGESKMFLKLIASAVLCAVLAISAFDGINRLGSYWLAGNGGGVEFPFWHDVEAIREKYGDEYRGSDVYIEDISHYADLEEIDIADAPITQELFFDQIAYCEIEYDWRAKTGGIDAWEQAEDGILVVNKDIFDRYLDRLVGHVIIQDDGYIYLIHDMY